MSLVGQTFRHGDITDKHLFQHFVAEQSQIVAHLHFMTLQHLRTIKSHLYAGRKMITREIAMYNTVESLYDRAGEKNE